MTEHELDAKIQKILRQERHREVIENRQRHGIMTGSSPSSMRARRKIRRIEAKARGF